MKASLFLIAFSVFIGVSSAALTCSGDKGHCAGDECCVSISPFGLFGTCKKLKQTDATCMVRPVTSIAKKHVYYVMCPCNEGLVCNRGEGTFGGLFGKCGIGSGVTEEPKTAQPETEEPETEEPETEEPETEEPETEEPETA